MKRSGNPENFLNLQEKEMVEKAITKAEKESSAEVKLVIVRHCWGKIEEKAVRIFKKQGLYETKDRNCVMIMLALANREFLIYGDDGINKNVKQKFWDETKNLMLKHFKNNEFGKGLVVGIESVGEKLKNFFPYTDDDKDEVSNEIAYED